MKRYVTVTIIFFLLATLLLPIVSADMDSYFRKDPGSYTLSPINGWQQILKGGKAAVIYLLLAALLLVGIAWAMMCGVGLQYRTEMQRVTPDIYTPIAAGQGQFGTARWMADSKKYHAFSSWKISRRQLRPLIEAGETDSKEIENANIQIG